LGRWKKPAKSVRTSDPKIAKNRVEYGAEK
jgi:hypothetical protein